MLGAAIFVMDNQTWSTLEYFFTISCTMP